MPSGATTLERSQCAQPVGNKKEIETSAPKLRCQRRNYRGRLKDHGKTG